MQRIMTMRPLTVEIVKDSHAEYDPTGHIIRGVERINEIAQVAGLARNALDIVSVDKVVTLSRRPEAHITVDAVDSLKPIKTDIRILGTDRRISYDKSTKLMGITRGNPSGYGGVAAVSSLLVHEPHITGDIASHELGHLLRLRGINEHCDDGACTMYKHLPKVSPEARETRKAIHLCPPCETLIAIKAFELTRLYRPN